MMTETVDTVKGTSKREKIKLEGPGILDLIWYGMFWYIWYHARVWYGTIDYSRNIIKHFYDFDIIFFDSTRKPCLWHSAHEFLTSQNHKNFL